jgi:hypothetical protein
MFTPMGATTSHAAMPTHISAVPENAKKPQSLAAFMGTDRIFT